MTFGPFRVLPGEQQVLEDGRVVPLGARALQILLVLLERAGEVVPNETLIARVWPGVFVEESNLRVHIASLRRALRDGQTGRRFIVNVPGRGYSLVAPVEAETPPRPERAIHLPRLPTRIVGRDEVVARLGDVIRTHRLLTIVGPGGIGKTTVALALARALAPDFSDNVAFADLSTAANAHAVPGVLAAVLGVASAGADAIATIVTALRQRRLLLVLDNCEHVIGVAAEIAELVLAGAPGVHLLATSREPLRALEERVHRLAPLASPPSAEGITAAQALAFPCVQLLVERATAGGSGFVLTDEDAPYAVEICQRLDGIALAVEFAAGRLTAFGMRDLAAQLDNRFQLLTNGRRTALPRHQTLAAMLDWSYELLGVPARTLLRRLAVFVGDFTAAAVHDMFAGVADGQALAELAELVAKSLVAVDLAAIPTRYRLLETTRLYALGKLQMAQELLVARRLHARHVFDRFADAEAASETMSSHDWIALYGRYLENMRVALDWAAEAGGDDTLLVGLAARAVPLWVQLSLTSECRRQSERALARLDRLADADTRRLRMELSAALGWSLVYGTGRSDEIATLWGETLALAEALDDQRYRMRALWGLWLGAVNMGRWADALALARRHIEVAARSADPLDRFTADRLMATTLHYMGDQAAAQQHMEPMLEGYDAIGGASKVVRFHVDQKVTARYFHARILWLRGETGRARLAVARNVREALALENPLSFASVLGQGACPVALYTGDLAAARRYGTMLLEHADRHQLSLWHAWARCFGGALTAAEGDLPGGVEIMRATLEELGDRQTLPRFMILLGTLAARLCETEDHPAGRDIIERLIRRCDASGERWFLPEAMRIRAQLQDRADAAATLQEADRLAAQQQAPAWRLRIALSLARSHVRDGRAADAKAALAAAMPLVDATSPSGDLTAARELADSL